MEKWMQKMRKRNYEKLFLLSESVKGKKYGKWDAKKNVKSHYSQFMNLSLLNQNISPRAVSLEGE